MSSFLWLHNVCKFKFFFASFSLQTNETHPGWNTSPSSFQKCSSTLFDIVFFLGIRPASQTCSPSSTLSLSFYKNFRIVAIKTILRSKFWVVCKQEKRWRFLWEISGAFQPGFFFLSCWVFPFRIRDSCFFYSFCFGHMRWLPVASRSWEDPHSILGHQKRQGCGHREQLKAPTHTPSFHWPDKL